MKQDPGMTNVYGNSGDTFVAIADTEFADVVYREINMGFTENPFFNEASGYKSQGCQRINYCSCDCNHCSLGIL